MLFTRGHILRGLLKVPKTRTSRLSTSTVGTSDFSELIDEMVDSSNDKTAKSFPNLFKSSKFVQLGDFNGRVVAAKVVHRVGSDLYIDFGGKFNVVCKAPEETGYYVGSEVLVKLHDPELSERFLGSRYDLTLLEADGTLIGLRRRNPAPKSE